MFNGIKLFAMAAAVGGMAAAQPAFAQRVGLSVGMGFNTRGGTTTFINPAPVAYPVPVYTGPMYAGPVYSTAYIPGGYGPSYAAPDYIAPLLSGPGFGVEQVFYQPNFYYGGGYYQTGGVSGYPQGYYGGYNYPGSYYYPSVVTSGYRTAPPSVGPRWNGQPSRLTFGPLSRW